MEKLTSATNFEEAVELLKNAVKDSHLKNQKHIDLTLVDASVRPIYEHALKLCYREVATGALSQDKLLELLGLK